MAQRINPTIASKRSTPNNDRRTVQQRNIRFRLAQSSTVDQIERRSSTNFRKTPIENIRECIICLLDQSENEYEERYSNECSHPLRRICDTCIYNYIRSILRNEMTNCVICPEMNCQSRLDFETIRSLLNRRGDLDLFERYDRQLTYGHLEQIREFVWCSHQGCGSGQFHDMEFNSNPMVICIKCRQRTCAIHRIKWHLGMTCEEYDQSKILSIDAQTEKWLNKYSKKCPKCKCSIQKISGCDHMTCRKCNHQFCWICFADYRKILTYGSKYHIKHCPHYSPIIRSYNYGSRSCNIL